MVAIVVATLVSLLVICLLAIKVIEFRDSVNAHLGRGRPLTQHEIATMASQIISGKPVQDPRAYVEHHAQTASLQTGMPYRDPPDIDQLKPASMNADQTNMPADETALIQHLARLTKPSGGYWLSANKLYAAIGGDRETVLAVIRAVRGSPPEPSEPYNPAKHLLLDGGERWIVR